MIQLCLNLKILKHAIAAGKTDCEIEFAPKMWATRPHLASIFEKLLDQKTFIYLRLVTYSQYQKTADMDFVRSFYCSL